MTAPHVEVISTYVLTFNCGRALIDIERFASSCFSGLTTSKLPDLLVLNLQEIAPLAHSFIGSSFLVPYFTRFYHAVQTAARKVSTEEDVPAYALVAARNLGMTGIIVLAKDPTAVEDLEMGAVGVGLWQMGNKGAVGSRFKYRGTELTFVSSHLAAMESALQRRNEDYKNIVRGLVFSSTTMDGKETSSRPEEQPLLSISPHDASMYKSTSHLFFAGDLNYRTSLLSPSPSDHIDTFPQPHHAPSHANHFTELFKSDQLTQELIAGRTCQGLSEAPVTFPPTYKYDPVRQPLWSTDDDVEEWVWAKHRWPSWCDRILYLEVPTWLKRRRPHAKLVVGKYSALPLFPTSDHRPVALELSIPIAEIPSPDEGEEGEDPRLHPPFEIDIDWKTNRRNARILELVVGYTAYFTSTWEGGGIVFALVVGGIGAYFAFKAMITL